MNSIPIQSNYNISATEVLIILNYLPEDISSKVPKKFIIFLEEHSIPNYNPNFDFSAGLDNLKLSSKTKALLAMIYRNYICSSEEKNEYDKILYKNDQNYNIELNKNLFKNNSNIKSDEESVELVEYQPLRWYKKLLKKFINFFS